jgi:hypothetical protein
MVELAPDGWLRRFVLLQVQDELRHCDFFSRVVDKLGKVGEPSAELARLRAELERCMDFEELLLHGQIIETAARVIFVGNGNRTLAAIGRAVKLPGSESVHTLVRAVVDLVGRDESRHIAFGSHCLKTRLSNVDGGSRHAMENRAAVSATLMHDAFSRRANEFRLLGTPPADVLDRTWQALQKQLARLELDIGSSPGSAGPAAKPVGG